MTKAAAKFWTMALVVFLSIGLMSCGSGGGGGSEGGGTIPDAAIKTVSGTAAAGAAMAGFVAVKDSTGETRTTDIASGGSFSLDVTGLTPPFLFYASGVVGDKAYTLYSAGTTADVDGTVNITPLTDLILANIVGMDTEEFFNNPDFSLITAAALQDAEDALKAQIQPILDAAGVPADFSLLNSSFDADHYGIDAVLDVIQVTVDPAFNEATLTNMLDPTQTITDSFTDPYDPVVLDIGAGDIGEAVAEINAIIESFNSFSSLFNANLAAPATVDPDLEAMLASTFMDQGESDANAWLLALLAEPDLSGGLAFGEIIVQDLDPVGGTATVFFNAYDASGNILGPNKMKMVKEAGLWKINGDQLISDALVNLAFSKYIPNTGSVSYNAAFVVNADVSSIPFDYIEVTGPGFEGTDSLRLIYSASASHGDYIVDANKNNQVDTSSPGINGEEAFVDIDDAVLSQMVDNGEYTFTYYNTQPAALPDPATDTVVGADVVVLTSLRHTASDLPGLPYPTITSPTMAQLVGFTSGDLNVSWTLAPGTKSTNAQRLYVEGESGTTDTPEVDVDSDATSITHNSAPVGYVTSRLLTVGAADILDTVYATVLGAYTPVGVVTDLTPLQGIWRYDIYNSVDLRDPTATATLALEGTYVEISGDSAAFYLYENGVLNPILSETCTISRSDDTLTYDCSYDGISTATITFNGSTSFTETFPGDINVWNRGLPPETSISIGGIWDMDIIASTDVVPLQDAPLAEQGGSFIEVAGNTITVHTFSYGVADPVFSCSIARIDDTLIIDCGPFEDILSLTFTLSGEVLEMQWLNGYDTGDTMVWNKRSEGGTPPDGSLSISGTDTSIIGTVFTPAYDADSFENWFITSVIIFDTNIYTAPSGTDVLMLGMGFSPVDDSPMVVGLTRTTAGSPDAYNYIADCLSGADCSGVSFNRATLTVTFTNVVFSPDPEPGNLATSNITLNGSVTFSLPPA